jgi:hypothetical protein
MPHDVSFLVDGREYPLSQRIAEALSENLIAFDPDREWEGSTRRSLARSIERRLVDSDEGPVQPQAEELSALEHTLDYMVESRDRELAILQRAARRALGLEEAPLLDEIIGDAGE